MKRAWWTTVAAAVLAMAGTISVGCKGSVEVNSQDPNCPAAMPKIGDTCAQAATGCTYEDGPCSLIFRCEGAAQAWQAQDASCTPEAVDCWVAQEGDTCAFPGDGCGEDSGFCGGSFFHECGEDHRWHSFSSGGGGGCCPMVGPCPLAVPKNGDSCDPCFGPAWCTYENACGGAYATCGAEGSWQVAIDDCPPPPSDSCAIHGAEADCKSDPACRWLVPGCGDPKLPQAGCFPSLDCAPDGCAAGLSCQKAVIDPCYGKACNTCSADALLCLP